MACEKVVVLRPTLNVVLALNPTYCRLREDTRGHRQRKSGTLGASILQKRKCTTLSKREYGVGLPW
jgi:hypothetical protein